MSDVTSPGGAATVACSLAPGATQVRLGEWRSLLATATEVVPSPNGRCAVFGFSPGVIAELGRLCAAEVACCPFFTFHLAITAESVVLTVGGPDGAEEAIAGLLDPSRPSL
jgi:hypothetical protein